MCLKRSQKVNAIIQQIHKTYQYSFQKDKAFGASDSKVDEMNYNFR